MFIHKRGGEIRTITLLGFSVDNLLAERSQRGEGRKERMEMEEKKEIILGLIMQRKRASCLRVCALLLLPLCSSNGKVWIREGRKLICLGIEESIRWRKKLITRPFEIYGSFEGIELDCNDKSVVRPS